MKTVEDHFVFWLHGWNNGSGLFNWNDLNQCTVNDRDVVYKSLNQPGQVIVDLSSITSCEVGKTSRSQKYHVKITTAEHEQIYLFPANPLDPRLILHLNKSEARTLAETINSLRAGQKPKLHTNPYLRQLNQKGAPARMKSVSENWDSNISPWVYFHKHVDNLEWIKYLLAVFLGAFLGTGLIMLVVYFLDLYGII